MTGLPITVLSYLRVCFARGFDLLYPVCTLLLTHSSSQCSKFDCPAVSSVNGFCLLFCFVLGFFPITDPHIFVFRGHLTSNRLKQNKALKLCSTFLFVWLGFVVLVYFGFFFT